MKQTEQFQTTKGWGPWKKTWFSVCSAHQKYKAECPLCNTGSYLTAWRNWLSSYIYERFPRFWRHWMNRKIHKTERIKMSIEKIYYFTVKDTSGQILAMIGVSPHRDNPQHYILVDVNGYCYGSVYKNGNKFQAYYGPCAGVEKDWFGEERLSFKECVLDLLFNEGANPFGGLKIESKMLDGWVEEIETKSQKKVWDVNTV